MKTFHLIKTYCDPLSKWWCDHRHKNCFFSSFWKEKLIFNSHSDLDFLSEFAHIEAWSNFSITFSKEGVMFWIRTFCSIYALWTFFDLIEGMTPFLGFSRNDYCKKVEMPDFAKFSKMHWIKSIMLKYGWKPTRSRKCGSFCLWEDLCEKALFSSIWRFFLEKPSDIEEKSEITNESALKQQ